MSGRIGGGAGGSTGVNGKGRSINGVGLGSIPPRLKKIVQSLKEIVNCPELEIYAVLIECNMDPNEAVDRLLSQDTFHEVKSKREKKKESKDAMDSRSRGVISTSTHGGRVGTERHGRAIMSQSVTSDSGASRSSKPSHKKDNEVANMSSSSHAHGVVGNNDNQWPPIASEAVTENKVPAVNTAGDVTSLVHATPSSHSAWGAVSGQVSMADIVKRGRPQGKAYMSHQITCQQPLISSQPSPTPHEWRSAQNHRRKVSETIPDSGAGGNCLVPPSDEWAVVEQPPASSLPSISDPSIVSEPYADPSSVVFDQANHQPQLQMDKVRYSEDAGIDSTPASRNVLKENSGGVFDDELYKNMNSYQAQQHELEHQEAEEVAANIQQLNIPKEEEEEDEEEEEEDNSPREADSPAVKIPDHLQVQSADCSHLSFGSFGPGLTAPFSGPFGSRPEKGDLEETSAPIEVQPVGHSDTRNTEYYGNEHLRTVSDEHIGHRLAATTGGYDMPSASLPETLKQEAAEVSPGNQYNFPSSSPNYRFENSQHLSSSFSHSQANSQMWKLPQLSGVMALKSGNFSTAQPTQNVPSRSGLSGDPALPQHLSIHPYSQPSLPFAAANMMGYPFLPPSYTCMPQSAFEQGFAAGSSTYHQSLASVLPQYKNSVSVSSLSQSAAAAIASGYGAFGSSNNVSGGHFPLNSPNGGGVAAAPLPSATSISYNDVLSSQYKEAAHMLAFQQGGPGSRTISAVPATMYYGFQGQTQHQQPPAGSGGCRQAQQLPPPTHSQHYGNLGGYPNNFYQSNLPLDQHHHQQMGRDGSEGGQPHPPPLAKQPQHQQIWQNTY